MAKCIGTWISATLLLFTFFFWLISYLAIDRWSQASQKAEYQVYSSQGVLIFCQIKGWSEPYPFAYDRRTFEEWSDFGDESICVLWKVPEFYPVVRSGSLREDGLHPLFLISIPYWVIALLLSILPVGSIRRWRLRQRRLNLGLCCRCGYELRGSSGRCPECGTLPALARVRHFVLR